MSIGRHRNGHRCGPCRRTVGQGANVDAPKTTSSSGTVEAHDEVRGASASDGKDVTKDDADDADDPDTKGDGPKTPKADKKSDSDTRSTDDNNGKKTDNNSNNGKKNGDAGSESKE
jgi:hypothetical protein